MCRALPNQLKPLAGAMRSYFAHMDICWGDCQIVAPGCQEEVDFIQHHPELFSASQDISTVPGNYASAKRVYLLTLPPPFVTAVVYKVYFGKAPFRFYLQKSLARREYDNYQLLEQFGVAVPERLACGDKRRGPHLLESFIATRFIPDMIDGREFMPAGALRAYTAECHEFCRMNLANLARVHRHNFYHNALHPRNVLWERDRRRLVWIDVARCRLQWEMLMLPSIIRDLYLFFWDMRLPRSEVEELLRFYQSQPGGDRLSWQELCRRLHQFRRRNDNGITSIFDF